MIYGTKTETETIYKQNSWYNFSVPFVLLVDIKTLIVIYLLESSKYLLKISSTNIHNGHFVSVSML